MNLPPLLTAAALLFWGYQTDLWFWAIPLALLLEGSRLLKTKWELAETDLNRIWDLCGLLFLGALVLAYTDQQSTVRGFRFTQWQPVILAPIMLAQAFGSAEQISLRTFSYFLRRRKDHRWAGLGLNFTPVYFAVCLLAASATAEKSAWFYGTMAALLSAALFLARPRRHALWLWILLLGAVWVGGHFTHQGLHLLQEQVEGAASNWLARVFGRGKNDPREAQTRIGELGQLKMSDTIVLRVQAESGQPIPNLLRETSYNTYRGNTWLARPSEFSAVRVDENDSVSLLAPSRPAYKVHIDAYLDGGKGILPLPHGAFYLDNLPVSLETNGMGAIHSVAGPGLVNYVAHYSPTRTLDSVYTGADLEIPERETNTITATVQALQLDGKTDAQKIQAVARFFQDKFTYTTYLGNKWAKYPGGNTALGVFLTQTHAGHCEYFATATVLLLRQAGIPARYAVGYSVQERDGETYIVRELHAHAWTLYYNREKKVWEELDTTPGTWLADEGGDKKTVFRAVKDFFSNLWFQFSKWRWNKETSTKNLIWILIPLVIFLVWRILANKRRRQPDAAALAAELARAWPGMDSEFYQLAASLARLGLERNPGEPLGRWLARVQQSPVVKGTDWSRLIELHQRLRFDPEGLPEAERAALREESARAVKDLENKEKPK